MEDKNMHNCPRCGQLTSGAWSEGGLLWAICDDCMSADSGDIRNDGFVGSKTHDKLVSPNP